MRDSDKKYKVRKNNEDRRMMMMTKKRKFIVNLIEIVVELG